MLSVVSLSMFDKAEDTCEPLGDSFYSDLCSKILIFISYALIVITFPFSIVFCLKVIKEYEKVVVYRLGRCAKDAKGPGLFFIVPCVDYFYTVDIRVITFDIKPQEVLTKDSVTVTVDAVIYFRIFDPLLSVNKISNVHYGTRLLAASTLRNILGTKTLLEILQEREQLAHLMQEHLDSATSACKDVRLPVQLQRAMAREAEAVREARGRIIAADGEKRASKALKEAANIISESPLAIQLRYLQALGQIASEKTSTIVFPIPIELVNFLRVNN